MRLAIVKQDMVEYHLVVYEREGDKVVTIDEDGVKHKENPYRYLSVRNSFNDTVLEWFEFRKESSFYDLFPSERPASDVYSFDRAKKIADKYGGRVVPVYFDELCEGLVRG